MAADETEGQPSGGGGRKGKMMQLMIVALLMIGEGVGVFFLARAIQPGPVSAQAGEGEGSSGEGEGPGMQESVEVELAECKPTNNLRGRLITYQLRVSALVSPSDEERVLALVEAKRARIRDRVNFVIRSADPKHLDEPGLETIKRRLKFEFARIFGDEEVIKEVLIPELLQSRAGD